jgi:hypothetical protein
MPKLLTTIRAKLQANIRSKLQAKILPEKIPLRARSGPGDGQACSGCELPIDSGLMWELEFPAGQIIRFHEECERFWRVETGN